jgi:hypothetical protein
MKVRVRDCRLIAALRRSMAGLPSVALVALCLAGTCACSNGAHEATRGDVTATQLPANKLTPEQCITGGEIEQASLRPDDAGYVIQPGDVLAVDFT